MSTSMHLIVQGHNVSASVLKQLAEIVNTNKINKINEQCFKLLEVDKSDEIASYCDEQQLDHAFMPANASLGHIGLVVMDMDSTLITIECIDEIADMHGIKPQVAAITERSMQGEIDFQQSVRERVALLKGLDAGALQRVYDERLKLTAGAETFLKALHEKSIYTLLISGGFTFFTDRLKARLPLCETVGNVLEIIDGKLSGNLLGPIIDAHGKAAHLIALQARLGLEKDQVIAIGDGANDIPMLQAAGYGIAFHGKPLVRAKARLAINYMGLDGVLNCFA